VVQYEALVVDLEQSDTINRQQLPSIRSFTTAEQTTYGVDPVYGTIPCEAAEQDLLESTITRLVLDYLKSHIGVDLGVEGSPLQHITPPDYYHSWEAQTLLVLYGLPASEFGYIRAITIIRKGRPVPFVTTVFDSALPTGLITSAVGKSSTVLQKLKYVVRGRRPHEEFESDEIDLSGALPPSIEVTIRRKRSAQLNRKKMR